MTNPTRRVTPVVLFIVSVAACHDSQPPLGTTSGSIVHGTPTTGSPATVYLDLDGGSCSGTLISSKVVLTAAHCLQGIAPTSVRVFFGSDATGPGTWVPAVHALAHANGDIGLIAMSAAGPTAPVPPFAGDLAAHINEPVHIVGFGVTSENGQDSGLKREGMATLISVSGDSMNTSTAMAATCYGDSGGPSYMTIDGVEYVAGVTSTGTAECGSGEDINTRTDTYIEWIRDYVMQYDAGGPCASDGTCNPACPDYLDGDPDCAGCENGGACRTDCPELDRDCCAADGVCQQSCGPADVDCADTRPDAGTDPGADDGAGGCCSSGGDADRGAWLLAIGVLGWIIVRRRLALAEMS